MRNTSIKLICTCSHGITSSLSPSSTNFMLSRTYKVLKQIKNLYSYSPLCLPYTWYDSLFEELLPQVRQEADDSFPGYFPQV